VVLGLTGLVLAVTNPDQATYESFATTQLVDYLSQEVCSDTVQTLGLNRDCKNLLRSNQTLIRRLIARQTQRQNFLFFSIYRTDLEIMALLPTYQFETVGGLGQFHVYKSEKK
jgi:hypothetical protein